MSTLEKILVQLGMSYKFIYLRAISLAILQYNYNLFVFVSRCIHLKFYLFKQDPLNYYVEIEKAKHIHYIFVQHVNQYVNPLKIYLNLRIQFLLC